MNEPRYVVTVVRKPGFLNWFCGCRYLVTLYDGERYKRLEHAGTLGRVSRVARALVYTEITNSAIKEWRTSVDFEVPR